MTRKQSQIHNRVYARLHLTEERRAMVTFREISRLLSLISNICSYSPAMVSWPKIAVARYRPVGLCVPPTCGPPSHSSFCYVTTNTILYLIPPFRPIPYDFLLTSHSNHEPISHRFRDKRLSRVCTVVHYAVLEAIHAVYGIWQI